MLIENLILILYHCDTESTGPELNCPEMSQRIFSKEISWILASIFVVSVTREKTLQVPVMGLLTAETQIPRTCKVEALGGLRAMSGDYHAHFLK